MLGLDVLEFTWCEEYVDCLRHIGKYRIGIAALFVRSSFMYILYIYISNVS
jgi:hypothetical protein